MVSNEFIVFINIALESISNARADSRSVSKITLEMLNAFVFAFKT